MLPLMQCFCFVDSHFQVRIFFRLRKIEPSYRFLDLFSFRSSRRSLLSSWLHLLHRLIVSKINWPVHFQESRTRLLSLIPRLMLFNVLMEYVKTYTNFLPKVKTFFVWYFSSESKEKTEGRRTMLSKQKSTGCRRDLCNKIWSIKHEKKSYDCELRGENCICFQMFVISSKRKMVNIE